MRRAFTLIEMLTVIAITAVMLTIIILPIFQSFNLTREAQAYADAQDKGRTVTERIAREIGDAATVHATSALITTTLNGTQASLPAHNIVVQVPGANGNITDVALPYSRMDLMMPAQQGVSSGGGFVNPITGKVDPTMTAPKGQIRLPLAPGQTLVRWFIGLRDPFSAYNDPYSGLLMKRAGGRDNLFVLYRASVQPYVRDSSGKYVGNTTYFQVDSDGQITDFDDPKFFLNDGADPQKADRIKNWLNKAVVQTEISRYDMILPVYDKASRKVSYDGNVPRLIPLVQFRPSYVSQEPAVGQAALRSGEETASAQYVGPDVFETQYALWNNSVVRTYPSNYLRGDAALGVYEVMAPFPALTLTGANTTAYSIYLFDSSSNPDDLLSSNGVAVFDVNRYADVVATGGNYPFTSAVLAAAAKSDWINNDPSDRYRNAFTPFYPLPSRGRILASFGIDQVGKNTLSGTARPNLPTIKVTHSNGNVYTALQDQGAGVPYSAVTAGWDVNRTFNRAYNEAVAQDIASPTKWPTSLISRFIDVRTILNEDGTPSPLYPEKISGEVTGFNTLVSNTGGRLNRCRITPGSETVYGPDQIAGPHMGQPIRYTRVTSAPGLNQYRINYVDQPEPVNGSNVIDYTVLGFTPAQVAGFDPTKYDPTNFISAYVQPRFKGGYIELNSDPSTPIPAGYFPTGSSTFAEVPFKISYRFQFTGNLPKTQTLGASKADVFAVDYDSAQLMQVLLTVRNFPQSTLPNTQTVTLKATATLRNAIR